MLNLDHTMFVAAAAPRVSQPATFVRVPAGRPGQLQPSFAELTTEDIIVEQPWRVDCGALQDSFDSREFFSELFADEENELREELSEEVGAERRSSKNALVFERAHGALQRSELIAPHKITSVRNDTLQDFRRQAQRSSPTRSPGKSPPLVAGRRRQRVKANEREKQRVVVLKRAMNVLKNVVPAARDKTKITKLEILKLALEYIASLKLQLGDDSARGIADGEDKVASSAAALAFEQRDLFVYCNDSQRDRAVTMANSWDDLA